MRKTFVRAFATVFTALLAASALPALADTGDAIATHVVTDANMAIKRAMQPKTAKTVAQVPPVSQSPVGGKKAQGLPTGFTYTFDFSVANPSGNIGQNRGKWLPGGIDAVAGYGFNPTTRVVASYYELQHYPVGFNSGIVPLYMQGLSNPIGSVGLGNDCGATPNCSNIGTQIDVATKDRFLLLNLEKLIMLPKVGGRQIPLVITPSYVSRTSTIAASHGNSDVVAFQRNPGAANSFPVYGVNTRTAQLWSVAFTLPFLKTPKMFGTFTLAPGRLNHANGINRENNWQLYQILYLEYAPNARTKFFFEPQSSRDYLPADPYPQHLMAYFLGGSLRVGKQSFLQVVLNSGGPTNEGPYGIQALTCQQLPCTGNLSVPTIGGLKATQVQIQFGIGSPSVIQF